jgi:hypothetical protein
MKEEDMKRLMMVALAAVATVGGALSVATPAAAQHYRHVYRGRYYGGWSGGWYGPGFGVYVGPGYGYGYYPYYGCRVVMRWDPYVGAYVRTRVCY